mmetsp:Transcript_30847/g.46807  ORF Transcript_30847/g.46807 Transcript_30847/m.46807 type:complete len:488 (-) Transcript_30847:69-1532(-)
MNRMRLVFPIAVTAFVVAAINIFSVAPTNIFFSLRRQSRRLQGFDPKTVELKSVVDTVSSPESLKAFFGLDILNDKSPVDLTHDLKYVTFGSSHVFGSGVNVEPGFSRADAFPYLLSPNVTNLAIRAHRLEYPSLCVESLLGDTVYDVAVILDHSLKPWNPNEPANLLGRRLRGRFPEMIIIYINHAFPLDIYWFDENGGTERLDEWAKTHAPEDMSKADPKFRQMMKNYQEQNKGKWGFHHHYDKALLDDFMAHLRNQMGKNTFYIDYYTAVNDAVEFMSLFPHFTCWDYHHPCHFGHKKYADGIQQVVQKVVTENHYDKNVPKPVHPWAEHDTCEIWFEGANEAAKNTKTPMTGFQYDCFLLKEKCSMELVQETGTMTITNQADTNQQLAVTFMATSPNHPKIDYPKVKIELIQQGNVVMEKIADPISTEFQHTVHVGKQMTLEKIPPGETVVRFTSMEPHKTDPFRLVSYLITDPKLSEPNSRV